MTLSINGKNFIAQRFGTGNCFVSSGKSWTVSTVIGETLNETGGTAQIVNRLVSAIVSTVTVDGIQYTYSSVKTMNDNLDYTTADVIWIISQDGSSGAPYCYNATPTPTATATPTGTPTATPTVIPGGPVTFVFSNSPSGAPSVSLDLSALAMRQATGDYHFEMNDVNLTNTSVFQAYFAFEVKLFSGSLSSCPSSGHVFDGLDRVSTSRNYRIKIIDPGEMVVNDLDFYQPSSIVGVHTVCLLVHGAWTREALEAELNLIPG